MCDFFSDMSVPQGFSFKTKKAGPWKSAQPFLSSAAKSKAAFTRKKTKAEKQQISAAVMMLAYAWPFFLFSQGSNLSTKIHASITVHKVSTSKGLLETLFDCAKE